MQNQQNIEDLLKKYNQQNILNLLNSLNNDEKEKLTNQILSINFEQLDKLYKSTKEKLDSPKDDVTPIEYIDSAVINQEEKKNLVLIGEQVIKNDEYAVVTMAGGQGTRLGCDGPKGTFKLDIGENGKYIFEILTETLKKCKNKYNVEPYWYIMTSNQNNNETISFFEKHNFFGYEKNKVKFFIQSELPLLTPEGKLVIDENTKLIKTASDGNGGVYSSLKRSNMIDDMKNKNIKWVYLCGVDNIMVNPIDPLFIGLAIKNKVEIASKSIVKKYADEKVGTFCKRNGKPDVIEYIELTEEMKNAKNKNGDFIYGESGFISHLFSLQAIEKICDLETKYHLAIKNNLYKFERFYFDVFKYFDDMLVMRVKREKEFAPIKNKEGLDSPKTACEIYLKNNT